MTTTVTTQAELDIAIKQGQRDIEIRSPRTITLTIGDTGTSHVTITGESYIDTCSGRVVRVTGSGIVDEVTGSGRVGWVTGWGRVVRVTGSGRVDEVTGSGSVDRVTGSGSVVRVTGSGRVGSVTGSGRVDEVTGSGRVDRAAGNAVVHLDGHAALNRAGSAVTVYLHSTHATTSGGNVVDLTTANLQDGGEWADHHAIDILDPDETPLHTTVAVLFKAVRDDLRSSHEFAYPIGETVVCPDWADTNECGRGLHFSPSPAEAHDYDTEATRYLECHVPIDQLRPLTGGGSAKCKASRALVLREVDRYGDPVTAQAAGVQA